MALKRGVEEIQEPKSPSKKAKFQDNHRSTNGLQPSTKAPLFVQDEVQYAITRHLTGDDAAYDRIKSAFEPKESTIEETSRDITIVHYIQALLDNVALLQSSCSDLVNAVLYTDWAVKGDEYVGLYMRFLANLLSVKGTYLVDVLRVLTDHLTWEPEPLKNIPDFSRAQVFQRSHRVLQYILRFVPAASHVLLRILTNTFPHQSDTRRAHVFYVKNLLKLLEYAPELREEVLALTTDRLVKIDVQVQEDLEDLAEELSEGVIQELPDLDHHPESWDDAASEDEVDADVQDEELRRTMNVRKNVEKMDAMMALLFEHYDREISESNILGGQDVLDTLLSQFVRTILPMQRSRHTQFLLFHFAQLSSQFMDTFVGTCIEIAFDHRQPIITRHSAAAYLASFVARGVHISPAVVRDVYDFLGQELTALRKAHEPACRGPDLWRYISYYNLVQSVLYIFCFRWRDLEYNLEDDGEEEEFPTTLGQDHEWRPGVKDVLSQNLFSRLNPLKVCSPAIVSEFARIAKHLSVVYVYHLLETNKRIRLSHYTNSWQNSAGYGQVTQGTTVPKQMGEAHQHLDAFFPFDPYHLPRSKKWIESDYREWKGIPGLDDDSEDDAEDTEDEVLETIVRDDVTDSTEGVKETP